jgi:WD40 repeat protein
VKHLLAYKGELTALAISPSGTRIAGTLNQTAACLVQVWDFESGTEISQFEIDGPPPKVVRLSPEGRRVISIANDYLINIWDADSGRRQATATLDGILSSVAIAPNGESILIGDQAGNIYCMSYLAS